MKQKSLKLNFVMNMILTMSSFIFPLITFPYISRILLPVGTGKVSFATSVISYFQLFASLGIPSYGIRECAKIREDKLRLTKTVQEILLLNIITSALSYIVFLVLLFSVGRFQEDRLLYFVISISIFFNVLGMEWLYKALEQYSYIAIRSIAFKVVALIAMFAFVKTKDDYVVYGAISIFASSASYIMNFVHVNRYISLKPVGSYEYRRHIKPIMTFFAMACATTIYGHLDTVMLGFMKTDADVGFYNAAVKIKGILVTVVTSLGAVLLPRSTYYVAQKKFEEYYRVLRKSISFVFIISIPLTIYFALFADKGIYFLSGEEYGKAIVPMMIIMPTVFFIALSNITGIQMHIPLGREKVVLVSEIVGAIVDAILNIMLIPRYGAAGAALGTLVAELVVLAYQFWKLQKEELSVFKEISFIKILIALVPSIVVALLTRYLAVSYFVSLAVSSMAFFFTYFGILIISKEKLVVEIYNQYLGKRIGLIIKV